MATTTVAVTEPQTGSPTPAEPAPQRRRKVDGIYYAVLLPALILFTLAITIPAIIGCVRYPSVRLSPYSAGAACVSSGTAWAERDQEGSCAPAPAGAARARTSADTRGRSTGYNE